MTKVRVPVLGTVGKSVQIEADAPSRTEVAAAIAVAVAAAAGGSPTQNAYPTLWRLIREIPANIVALAALATTGLVARTGAGTFTTRTITEGLGIDVTNGSGVAGNPTVALNAVLDDLADVDAAAPADGDVLTFDGSLWTAEAPTGGSGSSLVYANTTVPAGNTVANTAAETDFDSSYTIPADVLDTGGVMRVKLYGVYGTAVAPPTIRLRVKLDGATVLDTTAVTSVTSLTDVGWWLEAVFIVQSVGVSGDLEAQGFAELSTAVDTGLTVDMANTTPFTVDTTGPLPIEISVQWGTADADNTITLREMTVNIEQAVVPSTAAAPATATFLTEADETATLANSRQLVAGTNVTFDTSTPGELEISASGGGGNANVTPDTHPASPDAMDDEFEAGSLDSKWVWRNQGGATATLNNGSLVLKAPASGSYSFRIIEQNLSGSAWRFRCKLRVRWNASNFAYCTLVLIDSSSGRLLSYGPVYASGSSLYLQRANSVTSFNSNGSNATYVAVADDYFWVYLEAELSGTNLIFRYSYSGLDDDFNTLATEALATFIINSPDKIGFSANSQNSVDAYTLVDWFRKVA